jgi:hypothetical protein
VTTDGREDGHGVVRLVGAAPGTASVARSEGQERTGEIRADQASGTRWLRRGEWSRLVAPTFFVISLIVYVLVYQLGLPGAPTVRGDGEGYYAYLPSYLVSFDPSLTKFVANHFTPMARYSTFAPIARSYGFTLQPTGNWLDKYQVGEAILLTPFFLVGHFVAIVTGSAADGYSQPELWAVGGGALVYAAVGIAALRAVLRRSFSDGVTAATLVVIAFGTGLLDYATYDSMLSHAFSFAAVAVSLLCGTRWLATPSSRWRAIALGSAVGAVALIRVADVVLLAAVPLLGAGSLSGVRARASMFAQQWRQVGIAALFAALAFAPQALTWWVSTGHLIAYAYAGETFDFSHPQLIPALVSFDPHGLLPYAPALTLAFAGLGMAWIRRREMAVAVTSSFLLFWYLTSSWWDWSFPGGFGDRIFVDALPLLALPLGVLFASLRKRWLQAVAGVASGGLVAVDVLLMVAYWRHQIPFAGVDLAGYLHALLHP